MRHRALAFVAAAAVVALGALSAAPVEAQDAPRTAWGAPDLQGVWDFRTITPLERPEALGDRAFLTEEEAANLEQEVVERNVELANREARRTTVTESVDRGEEGAPGFYNNFWLDRGTRTVGTRRTSLVVDPPNGRLPEMSPAGRERTDGAARVPAGASRRLVARPQRLRPVHPRLQRRPPPSPPAATTRTCRCSRPPTTWC